MGYYKDNKNNIVVFLADDGSQDASLTTDMVKLTAQEEDAFLNPPNRLVMLYTTLVDELIANEIAAYNTANSTVFSGIQSMVLYKDFPTYTHYAFVTSMIAWNVQVWETARQIQADVQSGTIPLPTDAEFLAMLPARV